LPGQEAIVMSVRKTLPLFSLCLLGACGSNAGGSSGSAENPATRAQAEVVADESGSNDDQRVDVRHVLLISVDGLHEVDVANWIAGHPGSTLAELTETGVKYTDAHTPTPSDSFPGLAALVTGGTPKSTGLYYDDSYDRTLFPPGSNCEGKPGTEAAYFETAEFDDSQLFSPINPASLPHAKDAKGNCNPVLPHEFIRVNTIFEVIRTGGGYTAWSDKHPAYDWTNGPSGEGVDDLYTPEINSQIKKMAAWSTAST
jgi:hypothetical protein